MPEQIKYSIVNRRFVEQAGKRVEVCDVIYTVRGEKRPHTVDELRGCDYVRACAWVDQQNEWAGNDNGSGY